MVRFDVITIFPELFGPYLKEGLISAAISKKIIKINVCNLRDWTQDRHKTVDDRPFGGGRGMVMKLEPIFKAVNDLKKPKTNKKSKVILFSPRGRKFNQKMAWEFGRMNQLIFICGRYEGVDERVAKKIADIELSIGDYVLMGGELPAMVVIEAVTRLLPGSIGKSELLPERITGKKGFIEYPQYTRPESLSPKKGISWKVPKILLSGDHKKIDGWRKKRSQVIEK